MKIYILSIAAAALIAAVVTLLSPDGKGGGISKHLRLLVGLALICVIISPLVSFVTKLDNLTFSLTDTLSVTKPDCEQLFFDKLSDYTAGTLESELERRITEKFGLDEGSVSVRVEYSATENGVKFTRAVVVLSGLAIFRNPYEIEKFVYELTLLPCDCVI